MPSLLGLADVDTTREVRGGFLGPSNAPRDLHLADWLVDGVPLRDLILLHGGDRHPAVLGPLADVTYLVKGSDEAVLYIDRLLGWQADCDLDVDYFSLPLALEFERSAYNQTLNGEATLRGRPLHASRTTVGYCMRPAQRSASACARVTVGSGVRSAQRSGAGFSRVAR